MIALPDSVKNSHAVLALNRALDAGRLPHGILLAGDDLDALRAVADALASRILRTDTPASHPDFHEIRPANKMRRIGMEDTQELVRKIRVSSFGGRKIGLIHEADRMPPDPANAFLKTLEEPPPGTTLLLLTTKPNALLDTVRSRCLLFKVPPAPTRHEVEDEVGAWLDAFSAWLDAIAETRVGKPSGDAIAHLFLGAYGLVAGFETGLDSAGDAAWKKLKGALPDSFTEEQLAGMETGVRKNLRTLHFSGMLERLRLSARREPGDPAARRLATGVESVERFSGLLEANLSDSAAMETTLLNLLRSESARE